MTIRPGKESDYEELMKLYNVFYDLPSETGRHSNQDGNSFRAVIRDPKSFIFVAEVDSKLVGFATFSVRTVVRYPRPIAQLDELFVFEKYRKHGIGKKFIEQLELKSKELNCINIYIESGYKHKTAHKFYANLGYKKSGYYFKKVL